MKGTHRVIVQNKRIRYDFVIRRNLTIIRGDSATGKTTLVEMIREYYENGKASGVQLNCDKECTVLSGRNWKKDLEEMKDNIVFIDEGNEFIFTDEFAATIQDTDNYYIIVTREGIPSLPYSVEEIYGIRNAGKYGTLKQTFQEFFHIYRKEDFQKIVKPKVIVTEDSNAGYQFFKKVSEKAGLICMSAGGKSNVFAQLVRVKSENDKDKILVIADGAAFGAEMEKVTHFMNDHQEIILYLPESFEWLVLESGIIEDSEIREILSAPSDYIDSRAYFSWERFFAALLIHKTDNTYLKYSKRTLNSSYQNE